MGFREGAFAMVWEVRPVKDTLTKARVTISRKDRTTGEYVQDFGGFIDFVGTACATKALKLKSKDKIKLCGVDVSNRYDKEKRIEYTNYKVFDFEMENEPSGGDRNVRRGNNASLPKAPPTRDSSFVEVDNEVPDEFLPF